MKSLLIMLALLSALTGCNKQSDPIDPQIEEPDTTGTDAYPYTYEYYYDPSIFPNPERGLMDRSTFRYRGETNWEGRIIPQSTFDDCRANGYTTIWLYFGLEGYHDKPMPNGFISILEQDFNLCRENGVKLMVRFMYSSDTNTSPRDADLDMILVHMDQVKDVINNNKDVVFCLQFGWVGTFGETAYSNYFGGTDVTVQSDPENMAKRAQVVNAMIDKFDSEIMIQLRYPKDWIALNDPYWTLNDTLTMAEAYSGSKKARIGFYNDSYLYDYRDRGTYAPDQYIHEYKEIVRAAAKYTPLVGESSGLKSGAEYAYYQPDSVYYLSELRGLTALYDLYHPDVINYWKSNGVWDNLQKRMGYRYQLTSVSLSDTAFTVSDTLHYKLNILNTGFNQAFNPKDCEMVFTSADDTVIVDMQEDVRRWWKGKTTVVDKYVVIDDRFSSTMYTMQLRISDAYPSIKNDTRYCIRLANTGMWNQQTGNNNLGIKVTIE